MKEGKIQIVESKLFGVERVYKQEDLESEHQNQVEDRYSYLLKGIERKTVDTRVRAHCIVMILNDSHSACYTPIY